MHHKVSQRPDDRLTHRCHRPRLRTPLVVRSFFFSSAVSDDDYAHDPSTSAHGPFSPAPPTRPHILAVLKTIRGRAACAAAAADDNSNNGSSSNSYDRGGSNVYTGRDDGEGEYNDDEIISSPAALEAALEATDVSDENLRELADALASVANMASCSFQLLVRRRSASTTTTEQWSRLVHWTAIARALIRPHWPSADCIPPTAVPRQGLGPGNKTLSMSDGVRLLRRWHGLRLPVPCKHLLSAGPGGAKDNSRAPVTSLAYLPLSMLLVSGYSDGRVRLWDPCARRHKLAPPPPPPPPPAIHTGGRKTGSREDRGRGGLGRGRGRHLRLFPGSYAETAEEWTAKGQTFGCVATFGAVRAMTTSAGKRGGVAGGEGGGFLKVEAVDSIILPGGGVSSLVVCDPERVRVARAMDEEQPWDPASAGECVVCSVFLCITGGCLGAVSRRAIVCDVRTPPGLGCTTLSTSATI